MKTLFFKTMSIAILAMCLSTPVFASTCNVTKGDSLWRISKRYHLDFRSLCDKNRHLKDLDLILPNDDINLPNENSNGHSMQNHSATNKEGSENASQGNHSEIALEVLDLVNQERRKQGLSDLVLSHDLNGVATAKAEDMAEKNYFSHDSPTYGSPFDMMRNFGIDYSYAGENIAGGQRSAQQVMEDWMNSSGHRANILDKNYTQLGVGYAEGGAYGTYWVQEFIRP